MNYKNTDNTIINENESNANNMEKNFCKNLYQKIKKKNK